MCQSIRLRQQDTSNMCYHHFTNILLFSAKCILETSKHQIPPDSITFQASASFAASRNSILLWEKLCLEEKIIPL